MREETVNKMEPDVSRRITWIKSILCVLVIYVHCRNTGWFDTASAPGIAALQDRLCDLFAIFAVPAFFFFSGYLFFRNYEQDQLLRKWKSRLFTLVIPFIIWNLLYYFAEMLLRVLPFTAGAFSGTTVPFTFSAFLLAAFNCSYMPAFWFLQYLIIYTLLAPVIFFLLKKRMPALVSTALLFTAALVLSGIRLPEWTVFFLLLLQYLPAYLAGAFSALYLKKCFESPIPAWKALVFGTLCIFLILWQVLKPSIYSLEMIRLLFGAFLWLSLGAVRFPSPARWMRYTFFLYAAHPMIAKLANMAICIKVNSHMITGGIVWLLLPSLIIVVCTAAGSFFERFLPRVVATLGISRT